MATVFTWSIDTMKSHVEYEGRQHVVYEISWRLKAVDGAHNAETYGSTIIPYKDSTNFTAYNDLTEDQALKWAKDSMGAEWIKVLEDSLSKQIEAIKNPPFVQLPNPWN
jgi:hypothetical protein